jgi:6-phospho-beta-glucosidase
MRLESEAGSALTQQEVDWNPFEGATGYHRIAIDVMTALCSRTPHQVVVNILNEGSIDDLKPTEIVEVPALITENGAVPRKMGSLPDSVRGLTLAVKAYDHLAVRAAAEKSRALARLALLVNPIVGEWAPSVDVLEALISADPKHLGYLQ